MIFELVNAPATFMHLMDALYGPDFEPHVFKYLDDMIIVTETFEDHLVWLVKALGRMVQAGLKINVEKSELGCSIATFLGYLLDENGLRSDLDRVKPVLDFPAPWNIKQLRQFLGMCGWYSRFVEHELHVKVLLTKLLHNNEVWCWDFEQQQAFDSLKQALTEVPVLDVESRPQKFRNWKVENGMLYKYGTNKLLDSVTYKEQCWRLVVPEERRSRVMRDAHCKPSAGHLGRKKTYDRIAREYFWPGMWYNVQKFVQSCQLYQPYKGEQDVPKGLMSTRVVERSWAVIATDVIELPRSNNRYKYLVVFQDLFTKWVEFKPLTVATGTIYSGMGCTKLNKLLSCLDLPGVSMDFYKRYEAVIGPVIEKAAIELQKSCWRRE
ncbi:uncharacterized protein LOC131675437 [Phymastichus coffea]|uniref:uncharacterized protein LOC131675437 n=1 Tax=Phymastichus coffea TaxID=108790 RepID=UPI00273B2EAC|nr:uncharacterized protein LOC131675437 [Phymastichus coffea]